MALLVVGNRAGGGGLLDVGDTHLPFCSPISSLSDTMIMDSIAAFLVLPNRLLLPLVPDLRDAAQLRSPLPRVRPLPHQIDPSLGDLVPAPSFGSHDRIALHRALFGFTCWLPEVWAPKTNT